MTWKGVTLGLCLSSVGCSAGTALLKSPVDQQCQSLSLKGCPDLVDGVVLYAEGDKAGAQEKLRRARAANTKEDLQKFAQMLGAMTGVPGAAELAGPVTAMLLEDAQPGAETAVQAKGVVIVGPSKESEHEAAALTVTPETERPSRTASLVDPMALRAVSASVDPMRIETASLAVFSSGAEIKGCPLLGTSGLCIRGRSGPFVVTDIMTTERCPDRVFVAAGAAETPELGFRWLAEGTRSGITGARLLIRGGERLYVGVLPGGKQFSNSADCTVTWSGFQPFVVPQRDAT